jgi:hypothetical protein
VGGGMSHRAHHDPSWGIQYQFINPRTFQWHLRHLQGLSSQAISIQLWLVVCIPQMEPVTFYQFVQEAWVMSSGFIGDPEAGAVRHDSDRDFSCLEGNPCS